VTTSLPGRSLRMQGFLSKPGRGRSHMIG
jgi:hypothetical protein